MGDFEAKCPNCDNEDNNIDQAGEDTYRQRNYKPNKGSEIDSWM